LAIVALGGDTRLPVDAHASLMVLAAQLQAVQTMIGSIEKRIVSQHRSNKESKRLQTIIGIPCARPGPKLALATGGYAYWRISPTTAIRANVMIIMEARGLKFDCWRASPKN
jgi:hypothetical protein